MSIRTRAIYFATRDGWVDNFRIDEDSDGEESDDDFDSDDGSDDGSDTATFGPFAQNITGYERSRETFIIYVKYSSNNYLSINCNISYNFQVSRYGSTYNKYHYAICSILIDDITEYRMNMQLQMHTERHGDTYRSQTPELVHKLLDFVYALIDQGYAQTGSTSFAGDGIRITDTSILGNFMIDRYGIDAIKLYVESDAIKILSRFRHSTFAIEKIPGRESVAPSQTLLFKNY